MPIASECCGNCENLKCCGNCKNRKSDFAFNGLHSFSGESCDEWDTLTSNGYCGKWEHDELTKEKRKV